MQTTTTERADQLELVPGPVTPNPAPVVVQPMNTPDVLLQLAISHGADLDRLERLMAMKLEWNREQAKQAYFAAFAAFKAENIVVRKNKRVLFTSSKGTTDYRHAELSEVMDAVTPALSRHGLSVAWRIKHQERNWIVVEATLRHADGYSESVEMGGPPDESGNKNPIQAIASTQTYLARQTVKAVCGVAEKGDDDDGRGGPSTDEAAGQAQAKLEALIEDGMAKALGGEAELNKWWTSLTARQRNEVGKSFGEMKKRAREAQNGGA